jgi:hypothetical protein
MSDLLATPSDLAAWTGRTITANDPTALVALATATGWIQAETGQRLVAQSNETVTLRGGRPSLWLPEAPVTAVGAVTTTDYRGTVTARTLNTHYFVIGNEIRWNYFGVYAWPGLSGWPELVTVTYSHGYTQIPEAIRGVCLAAASRVYDNPSGRSAETVGGVSWQVSVGVAGATGLNQAERDALAAFRQLVVA